MCRVCEDTNMRYISRSVMLIWWLKSNPIVTDREIMKEKELKLPTTLTQLSAFFLFFISLFNACYFVSFLFCVHKAKQTVNWIFASKQDKIFRIPFIYCKKMLIRNNAIRLIAFMVYVPTYPRVIYLSINIRWTGLDIKYEFFYRLYLYPYLRILNYLTYCR